MPDHELTEDELAAWMDGLGPHRLALLRERVERILDGDSSDEIFDAVTTVLSQAYCQDMMDEGVRCGLIRAEVGEDGALRYYPAVDA